MPKLEELIQNKKAKVIVIGMGYVGLPRAVEAAKAGFSVVGIDTDKNKVRHLNIGRSCVHDIQDEEIKTIIRDKKFKASDDYESIKTADVIIICVPTPLDKYKNPDISYIQNSAQEINARLDKNKLIILESTTFPGTVEEVLKPLFEKGGMRAGEDFYLASAPERIDPGRKIAPGKIPKIVGGSTPHCTKLATLFYQQCGIKVFPVSSSKTAEMTKLLENTFRLVNISFINELSLLCDKMRIDIWEAIKAAKTKPYGFMPFYPSPGAGGHCIPLDPFYLSWKAREYGFWTRFIELAGEINQQMPHSVVTKADYALNKSGVPFLGSKILIWGVTYKKDIADTRESAAYPVISDLLRKGANIDYFDPYVPEFKIENKTMRSIKFSLQVLRNYDCLLILVDHSGFDYESIAKNAKGIVDTRNAIKSRGHKNVFRLSA